MKNLLNPRWLLLISILPVILLLVIFHGNYTIIESLLSAEQKTLWLNFCLALIGLTCLQLVYIIFCIIQKKQLSIYYALITLMAYSALIYYYSEYSNSLLPNSVPNWMISSDVILYPGTFLMPTLAHALFLMVIITSSRPTKANATLNFLYSLSIPLAAYLFVLLILPLWQNQERHFGEHTLIILFIAASILFLFFFCRAIYMLTNIQSANLSRYAIYWKITIAIVFPLLGLAFNEGLFSNAYKFVFGDFSHPWFYIIAIINGILICMPAPRNISYRLIRFTGLMICFAYTIYFFLVFLPYLPLAIVAVFMIGIGFLMLAPLLLFIIQSNELYIEFKQLNQNYSTLKITVLSIISLSIIPLIITGFNLHDKSILNNALTYVYSPDYTKTYHIDKKSLQHTLTTIKTNKGGSNIFNNNNTPFLSSYYNWLVLDNMILSETRIKALERIFFGERNDLSVNNQDNESGTVKLSKIRATSRFDKKQQSWISTLDLELTNPDDTNLAIYNTELTLPKGCWISDYYLNIGNRREQGILVEKKSALWVFSQIRNENRDPGILYYLTGNKVAFKVFPFAAKEVRKSGIEFLHKEPFTLNFDGMLVPLGKTVSGNTSKIESINYTTYIPTSEKSKLKLINRKPIYHFIIDVSKGKEINTRGYLSRIQRFIQNHQLKIENIRLNLTNSFVDEIYMKEDWKTKLSEYPFEGGFYLDAAIKTILVNNYKKQENTFPVMVVLTDNFSDAIINNDFSDFEITYPESPVFYELDIDHKLWIHALNAKPKLRSSTTSTILDAPAVYAWPNATNPNAFLANDNQPSIVIDQQTGSDDLVQTVKKSWLSGLNLQGMQIRNTININSSEDAPLQIIKQSMMTELLSQLTSFIVVENQAQKMALLKKQEQIISGNKNLDPDEDTQSMAEPDLYLMIGLLLTLFIIFKFDEKKKLMTLLKPIDIRIKDK